MQAIFLLLHPIRRKPLSDLQLKKLAEYLFTISQIIFASVFLKFFEKKNIVIDRNSIIVLLFSGLLSILILISGLFILGKAKEE